MSYRCHKFDWGKTQSRLGRNIGEVVNEFLALNQFITVIGLTTSWKEGAVTANLPSMHIWFRKGGARHFSIQFNGDLSSTIQDQVSNFFDTNTDFLPVSCAKISPPSVAGGTESESIIVIFLDARDLVRCAHPGAFPQYAPVADLNPGDWGYFRRVDDPLAPQVTALNHGNAVWPRGAPGFLIRTVDGCPDGEGSYLVGISPACYASAVLDADPLLQFPDCGCLDYSDYYLFGGETPRTSATPIYYTPVAAGPTPAYPG
jgi:hypothetical protein